VANLQNWLVARYACAARPHDGQARSSPARAVWHQPVTSDPLPHRQHACAANSAGASAVMAYFAGRAVSCWPSAGQPSQTRLGEAKKNALKIALCLQGSGAALRPWRLRALRRGSTQGTFPIASNAKMTGCLAHSQWCLSAHASTRSEHLT